MGLIYGTSEAQKNALREQSRKRYDFLKNFKYQYILSLFLPLLTAKDFKLIKKLLKINQKIKVC